MRDGEGARKSRVRVIGLKQLSSNDNVFLVFGVTQYIVTEMSFRCEESKCLTQVSEVEHVGESPEVGKWCLERTDIGLHGRWALGRTCVKRTLGGTIPCFYVHTKEQLDIMIISQAHMAHMLP